MSAFIINLLAPVIANWVQVALLGLLTWATKYAIDYIKARNLTESSVVAITQVSEAVRAVVDDIGETMIKKAVKAMADGKIDADELTSLKSDAKKLAITNVKNQLTPAVISAAGAVIGDLNAYVSSKIEQYVAERKTS